MLFSVINKLMWVCFFFLIKLNKFDNVGIYTVVDRVYKFEFSNVLIKWQIN